MRTFLDWLTSPAGVVLTPIILIEIYYWLWWFPHNWREIDWTKP